MVPRHRAVRPHIVTTSVAPLVLGVRTQAPQAVTWASQRIQYAHVTATSSLANFRENIAIETDRIGLAAPHEPCEQLSLSECYRLKRMTMQPRQRSLFYSVWALGIGCAFGASPSVGGEVRPTGPQAVPGLKVSAPVRYMRNGNPTALDPGTWAFVGVPVLTGGFYNYNWLFCNESYIPTFTVVTAPSHGTVSYQVGSFVNNGPFCNGATIPDGLAIYTWTDTAPADGVPPFVTQDSFTLQWNFGPGTGTQNYTYATTRAPVIFPSTANPPLNPQVIWRSMVWIRRTTTQIPNTTSPLTWSHSLQGYILSQSRREPIRKPE